MFVNDPIADLLTRIRNGQMSQKRFVDIPMSKIKLEVVKILESEGFITSHEIVAEGKFPAIRAHLKYDSYNKGVIQRIKRVSKPGLREYRPHKELNPVRSGLATRILTTSDGVMTDREARKRRIGGEVLCEVY